MPNKTPATQTAALVENVLRRQQWLLDRIVDVVKGIALLNLCFYLSTSVGSDEYLIFNGSLLLGLMVLIATTALNHQKGMRLIRGAEDDTRPAIAEVMKKMSVRQK